MAKLGEFQWRWLLIMTVLWLLVMLSAIAVVNSTHQSRIKLNQLELAKRMTNGYQVAWGQYLLEQSTLASYGRVESVAKKQLGMKTPAANELVILK
ncbi:cell division protein FtsL [Pseudoteredinibacter isoporae]|uniref:cell division protein FtsL n=1 Tax=Pseudoteredinibacter isoporae TaxID=570281 RepID=UPI0031054AF4